MLQDTITLINGAKINNMVAPSGTAFPTQPDTGELFFNTTTNNLFVYIIDSWIEVGSNSVGGGAVSSVAGKTGAVTLDVGDISGLSDVATSGNYSDLNGAPTSFNAANLSGGTLAGNVTNSSLTSVGTLDALDVTGAITSKGFTVGYLEAPGRNISNVTLALSDSGKHLKTISAGLMVTVPGNATVPFPIGTTISIVNPFIGTCTITSPTDTMYLGGSGADSGDRTLGQFGICTLLKIANTQWIISGVNLT